MTIERCVYGLIYPFDSGDSTIPRFALFINPLAHHPYFGKCALNKVRKTCLTCFNSELSERNHCHAKRRFTPPSFPPETIFEVFPFESDMYLFNGDSYWLLTDKSIAQMKSEIAIIKISGDKRINKADSLNGVDAFSIELGKNKKILL
jgi:hypothetical protein